MRLSLRQLRQNSDHYHVEPHDAGFAILKTARADGAAFHALVQDALNSAGEEFVALPRSDGSAGYDGVFIIPLE